MNYRIYSINRPGRLLNFWTLRGGAYSRWALIRGWALIKFSPFSTSVVCIFCNKTVNGNNKTRGCNKATFLQNTLKKTPSSGKSLISTYSFFWVVGGSRWVLIWVWVGVGGGVGWGGVGVFAYSRWALIRVWAPIRINTVILCPCRWYRRITRIWSEWWISRHWCAKWSNRQRQ